MTRAEETKKTKRISVLNWIGTILVCGIPGVNLIASILMIIFAKTPSKRNYAIAVLIWCLVLAALVCVAFLAFPDYMSRLADTLRGTAAAQISIS